MATPINVQPEFSDAQMAWLRSHPAFQPTTSDSHQYLDHRQAYKQAVSIQYNIVNRQPPVHTTYGTHCQYDRWCIII